MKVTRALILHLVYLTTLQDAYARQQAPALPKGTIIDADRQNRILHKAVPLPPAPPHIMQVPAIPLTPSPANLIERQNQLIALQTKTIKMLMARMDTLEGKVDALQASIDSDHKK